jgi:hypothetical protein
MKTLLIPLILFVIPPSVAQTNDQSSTYHSEADDLITIDKVSYLNFLDNLNGIYARPLETHFAQVIGQMHRWGTTTPASTGGLSLEELEEDSARVMEIGKAINADAFFAGKIIKGPKGIVMKLDFFLTKDGKLFLQSEIKDFQQFDVNILQEQMDTLLTQIVHKIPYSGRILSRETNRVTINVGTRDGVEKGRIISVIQIIKLNRHPRFGFLVSADKEIIGKVKVLKVDDTLSFGSIVMEKQRGALQKGSKLDALEFISYSVNDLSLAPGEGDVENRGDSKIAFGNDAHAWKPQATASLGQVGAHFGISRMNESATVGTNGLQAGDAFAPIVSLDGELWLTSTWTIHALMQQGIISLSNPLSGSTPSRISAALSAYELLAGYRFRFGPSVWSPYAEPFLGYFTHKVYVDATSPTAFTTSQYSGLKFGIEGATPITEDYLWSVGGRIAFVFQPYLSESPVTSGSSSNNTVNQFGIWTSRKMTEHWRLQGDLTFELFSSNFSGTGSRTGGSASTSSERFFTLSGGMYYLF